MITTLALTLAVTLAGHGKPTPKPVHPAPVHHPRPEHREPERRPEHHAPGHRHFCPPEYRHHWSYHRGHMYHYHCSFAYFSVTWADCRSVLVYTDDYCDIYEIWTEDAHFFVMVVR